MKRTWDSYDTPLWVTIVGWIVGIIFALGVIFGLLCLESWLIMLLWNATLPAIFCGVPLIGFWRAVCLNLLVGLLSGGMGRIVSSLANRKD